MTSQVNLIKNRVNPFYITDEDVLEGEVETYADLPATANLNDVYVVRTTTGIIGNRKLAGLYVYAVSGWVAMPIAMISSNVFYDNTTSGLSANTVKNALDELNSGEKHVTSASFNTGDGVLTLTLNDSSTVTVNLDGRFLQNIIEDTTPQLGGNLDLNSNNITGTGDIDITGEITATTLIGNMRGATIFQAKAGEALIKGDPVYISGDDLVGNKPIVSIADSDNASKMPCFGLAAETVSANANVNVVTFGTLSGLDTSSYSQGDILYISTTGTLTATKPTGESSLIQNIGKVMRSHASVGSIKVGGAGRTNDVPNLNNGNVFIGNASNQSETRSLTLDDVAETATNKHFTSSDNTKLDGIESGADVTDTTNVDAAGAVMNTDTSTASMDFVVDEDNMSSNSDSKIPTQQSVKAYVDAEVNSALSSEMTYKGSYNASTNTPDLDTSPSGIKVGDMYTVTVAGTFYTEDLSVGDVLIAEVDNSSSLSDWTIVSKSLDAASIKTLYESNSNTNAFTDTEKTKLSGISSGAEVNVNADWNAVSGDAQILNKPTDITDLSAHNVTELADITSAGSGSVITSTERTKLTGIEAGAEVNVQSNWTETNNASDSFIQNKPTTITGAEQTKLGHITVSQAVDLDTMESDITTNNAKVTNATHTGDVTGSEALTIANEAVTNAKMAHIATGTVKGRTTAGTGDVEDINIDTTFKTALNLAKGDVGLGNVANVDTTNASNISSGTLAEARLPSNINATKIANGTISNTEFQYLDGVTSNIQTQLNNAGGGGISSVEDDTSPVLGGNLDANDKKIEAVDLLNFNNSPTASLTNIADVNYNSTYDTLELKNDIGEILVGQTNEIYVTNGTGGAFPAHYAVYKSAVSSAKIAVNYMIADGTISAKDYLGITTETIQKNGDGKVMRFGRLDNFDTSSYSVNDTLYLSSSSYGGFTTTQPTGSNIAIATATVLTSSTSGSIFVNANNIDLNVSGGGDANVQSNWTETDTNSDAFILNKPTLAASATTDTTNASNISSGTLNASRLPSNIDATKIADGTIGNSEFQRLNGVSSDIQPQLNAKLDALVDDTNPYLSSNLNCDGNEIINPAMIDWDTATPSPITGLGEMSYDLGYDCLRIYNDTGKIHYIGQNQDILLSSAETVTIGQCVSLKGTSLMGFPQFEKFIANGTKAAKDFVGLAITTIATNANKKILKYGYLSGVDTSSYSVGDKLYPSASTAGALTNTQPTGSNVAICVATVATSATNGTILVHANNIDLNASGSSVTVDSTLSTTSTNPVENQAVTNEINTKQDTITGTTDITMNALTTNGNIVAKEDQDMSIVLGRLRIDSRFSDSWNLSHYDLPSTSQYQISGNLNTLFLNGALYVRLQAGGNTIANVIDDGIEFESGNGYYMRNNANLFHGTNTNDQTPSTTATSYYPVFGNNAVTNTDIYTYVAPSSSTNTGIRLLKSGKYKVSYTLNWNNTSYNNRINFFSRLVKHSSGITPTETEFPGTRSFGYARDDNFAKYATTTCVTVIDVAANEYIKCKTEVAKNDSTFNDNFSGVQYHRNSSIVIEYLGSI